MHSRCMPKVEVGYGASAGHQKTPGKASPLFSKGEACNSWLASWAVDCQSRGRSCQIWQGWMTGRDWHKMSSAGSFSLLPGQSQRIRTATALETVETAFCLRFAKSWPSSRNNTDHCSLQTPHEPILCCSRNVQSQVYNDMLKRKVEHGTVCKAVYGEVVREPRSGPAWFNQPGPLASSLAFEFRRSTPEGRPFVPMSHVNVKKMR